MEDREKLILQKIAEEESIEKMQLRGVKSIVYEILINEKAFFPEEIQIDPQFMLTLSTCDAKVSIDFMITLEEISFMVIKCVSSGIEPWERYAVAFARVIKNYQIPYAVITDGEHAKVIDVINDSFVYGSVQELFARHAAMNLVRNFQKISCPEKRREKEKRIIYAFEGIKCQPDK